VPDNRLLDFELELPFLLLALGLLLSLVFAAIGIFTKKFAGYRWRLAVAPFAFAFTAILGLFATVRFKMEYLSDWMLASPSIAAHFEGVTVAIFLFGYIVFGVLGCWLAVRVFHPLDRNQTLKALYALQDQNQNKQD
jgi:hypothetical protein